MRNGRLILLAMLLLLPLFLLCSRAAGQGHAVAKIVTSRGAEPGIAVTDPAPVTYWAQLSQLQSDRIYAYRFGHSVAISGDIVVVGASPYGDQADVYVKPNGQWPANMLETAALIPPVSTICSAFGSSVAIQGNLIVVGDSQDNCGTGGSGGAVYVFVEPPDGWSGMLKPIASLTASDSVPFAGLGTSVAISGDTIVAGAPATYLTNGMGSAYVFVKSGKQWQNSTETAKLTATDGTPNDWMGYAVAASADTIAVGRPDSTTDGMYVYAKPAAGWTSATQTAKLTASDGTNQALGYSTAMSGGAIVAGAPYANIGSNMAQGAAYVFLQPAGGWVNSTQTAKLTASNGNDSDQMGSSVALGGDTIVAGAPNFSNAPNALYSSFFHEGAAYVFVKPASGWANGNQFAQLTGASARFGSYLGTSVAIDNGTVVAGAEFNKRFPNGAAYIFGKFQQ